MEYDFTLSLMWNCVMLGNIPRTIRYSPENDKLTELSSNPYELS